MDPYDDYHKQIRRDALKPKPSSPRDRVASIVKSFLKDAVTHRKLSSTEFMRNWHSARAEACRDILKALRSSRRNGKGRK